MPNKGKNIVFRFIFVYFLLGFAFAAVFVRIIYIQIAERKPLLELANKISNNNTTTEINSTRGNIYASDGRLLSASTPNYYIAMDMTVDGLQDTLDRIITLPNGKRSEIFFKKDGKTVNRFEAKLDSTATQLADLFQDKSKDAYKTVMLNAYKKQNKNLRLVSKKISYVQWLKVNQMAMFRAGKRNKINLGGLKIDESFDNREKPFGTLAERTLGNVTSIDVSDTDSITGRVIKYKKVVGQYGLEQYFDKELTGKSGIAKRQKVANKNRDIPQTEAVAGDDIYTTIDIDIQDLAESVLRQNMGNFGADSACAIVMTTDGEIKACVNLFRTADGKYAEINDMAMAMHFQFGSTFKTVSMMLAFDNKLIQEKDTFDAITSHVNPPMSDTHSPPKHYLNPAEIIAYSNNIAMSNLITEKYKNAPRKFYDGIESLHILDKMNIQNAALSTTNYTKNISLSHIARICCGLSIDVPPIYTLRFYNAIANGGQMVEPRLVKYIKNEGEIVKVFDKKIINPKICSDTTLKIIKSMLEGVVNKKGGTGHDNVRSNIVKIAGKTGTADDAKKTNNYASFCGYFPADAPKYTCIVAMLAPPKKTYGTNSGSIFKQIAEGIMTMHLTTTPKQIAADSTYVFKMPDIKNGDFEQLKIIAKNLKLPLAGNNSQWITAAVDSDKIFTHPLLMTANAVPNVIGMGAKDAVYLMELYGLKVTISGYGKVIKQSLAPGTQVVKEATVLLTLQ